MAKYVLVKASVVDDRDQLDMTNTIYDTYKDAEQVMVKEFGELMSKNNCYKWFEPSNDIALVNEETYKENPYVDLTSWTQEYFIGLSKTAIFRDNDLGISMRWEIIKVE